MSRSSAASKPSSGSSDGALTGDGPIARFERAAAPYAQRVSESPAVRALQGSLPIAFAVAVGALVARLAVLLAARPFPGWPSVGGGVVAFLPPAFALASVAMVVLLSSRLARELRIPVAALVVASCAAFVLALPREALASLTTFARFGRAADLAAATRTLGVSGVCTAILVTLVTAGAVVVARRHLGAQVGTAAGIGGVLALLGVAFALRISPASALAGGLAPLATLGDSFAALAAITAIESVLWLVGVHGPALLAAIVFPVYLQLQIENASAFGHHQPIPHVVVVSTFLFVFPGGAGATLPLVLLLLRSRVRRLRTFAFATLGPALINVNEPVIFLLPVAYNPVLAIPFVVAPLALACTTYAAMASGAVARPLFYSPSSVPSVVNAFLTTLDWHACVLLVGNVALAGAIWFPFVRLYERTEAQREARAAA